MLNCTEQIYTQKHLLQTALRQAYAQNQPLIAQSEVSALLVLLDPQQFARLARDSVSPEYGQALEQCGLEKNFTAFLRSKPNFQQDLIRQPLGLAAAAFLPYMTSHRDSPCHLAHVIRMYMQVIWGHPVLDPNNSPPKLDLWNVVSEKDPARPHQRYARVFDALQKLGFQCEPAEDSIVAIDVALSFRYDATLRLTLRKVTAPNPLPAGVLFGERSLHGKRVFTIIVQKQQQNIKQEQQLAAVRELIDWCVQWIPLD